LLDDDIDDVLAIPVARLPQKGLLASVVVAGIVDKLRQISAIGITWHGVGHRPTGEGTGRLFHVILAVIEMAVHAHAHREQLQQFPPPVFVDGALMAHTVVQIEDHGRVDGKFHEQVAKIAHPKTAEHINLEVLLSGVLALGVAGA
jgi:hypothetical protein